MGIRYHDLEIEIDRCCCGEQEIRVLESTYDRPRARFALGDEQRAALETKVKEFDDLLIRGAEHASRRRQLAEEIGIELYGLLLPLDTIRPTLDLCRAALGEEEGLRLRLSFGRSYDRQLGSLPWELLCNPQTHRFIASERETPVVRYLDLGERIEPLDVQPPFRVLPVIASPDPATSKRYRYTKIDPAPHQAILEQAIAGATNLQLRPCLDPPTLSALREKLIGAERAGKPFHALHFLGHGGFNEDGEGALFFEREDGSEHMVTGAELARQLTRNLRLVVLASCSTGRIPLVLRNGEHPFAGVASALVAAGKPAVVAMQFSVSEPAAAAFAQGFYRAIDADEPIDDAVTEGRLAIEADGEAGDLEWATPVLFLRSADGRILNLVQGGVPPKTVAVFNTSGFGKEKMEYVDFRVDLIGYFDGRFIRTPEDWNGAILDELRLTLRRQVPPASPCHFELAAPLSVAFACGFLMPAKDRRTITVGQRDDTWRFDGDPPPYAPPWLDDAAARALIPPDFPFEEGASDIAVVVEGSRPALGDVAAYLRRRDLAPALSSHPPRVRDLVYARFEDPGQFAIKDGGHAQRLAEKLVERIQELALSSGRPPVHLFLAGPQGLALALGRLCHVFPRIQVYEFDFEGKRDGTYEPSITLVPPEMGETP